jgi:phenylpropionate dioxygenase-like ring-hydroxylating dioxygenase large terminal subunit
MPFARNAWYCAAFGGDVGDAPVARRILGDPIMLVRDTGGAVRALGDRCPHRFAPLHLGVRDGDTIECPYHGLKFDLNGACIFNPHGQGRIPAAARVPSYPAVERDGVVWLWPGDPALANEHDIPDLQLIDRGDREPVSGYLTMQVDYRLVLDFRTEDEPMIAACQNYMDGREFFSLQPLYLETDFAGTRCRRVIEKRIANENQSVSAVEPQLETAG